MIRRTLSAADETMEQSNVPLRKLPPDVKTAPDVKNMSPCEYLGPIGILRASHREFDPNGSTQVYDLHCRVDLIPPRNVAELNVVTWPMAILFPTGEGFLVGIFHCESEMIHVLPVFYPCQRPRLLRLLRCPTLYQRKERTSEPLH